MYEPLTWHHAQRSKVSSFVLALLIAGGFWFALLRILAWAGGR